MKTKTLLIATAMLFLQTQTTFSQPVNVGLSIIWETGYDIFVKDSVISVPKLTITYRNNSDSNLYFRKIFGVETGLPNPGCRTRIIDEDDEITRSFVEFGSPYKDCFKGLVRQEFYANWKFDVRIMRWGMLIQSTRDLIFLEGRMPITDTNHRLQVLDSDINCYLDCIYFNHVKGKDRKKSQNLVSLQITPEETLDWAKDDFVFLNPKETYADTVNLIGFKLVEGCFTFFTNRNSFWNYVTTDTKWDWKQKKYIITRTELPAKIDDYYLYSGSFSSNEVEICFPASLNDNPAGADLQSVPR
jgi:hypothetical protein